MNNLENIQVGLTVIDAAIKIAPQIQALIHSEGGLSADQIFASAGVQFDQNTLGLIADLARLDKEQGK